MKTFPQLWAAYVEKHPTLANPDARLTMPVSQLKAALELAHDEGRKCGLSDARSANTDNLFNSMFGHGGFQK